MLNFVKANKILSIATYYNWKSLDMFPNDDICNVKAAKNAARRIF